MLDDPANFLHSIDVDGDRAFFFRTSSELLRNAPFVDGRLPIALAETEETSLSELLGVAQPPAEIPDRLMFNCSFCGSTLLARLLDVPGRSLVIKEPRCLSDIAGWKNFNIRDGLPIDRLPQVLTLARAALRRPFAPGEQISVKVASQGNVLLEELAADAAHVRPIFITIGRLDFLRAIFRGGIERMQYAATLAWHMATGVPDGDALLREAAAAGRNPLGKAANLAILARYFQVGWFQRAARAGGWDDSHVIDYQIITQSPGEATAKAARALGIDIDDNQIERNVQRHANRDAKRPGQAFSNDQRDRDDRLAHAEHRQVYDEALAWAESTLGPQRAVVV